MFDLADIVPLTVEIRDTSGALANATTVIVNVILPDGTTSTPAVSNPTIGRYQADYTPTQSGRHTVRWVATGANASGFSDAFDVRESTPPYIVSLADARAHLNLTSTTDDEELRGFVEAATRIVEDVVGPVVTRTITEIHQPGSVLALRSPPVLALTSVAQVSTGGLSYDINALDVDSTTGIVRPLTWGAFGGHAWACSWPPLRVTYTAGRRIIPATMTLAAKVIIGHMWETQRGHGAGTRITNRPGFGGSEDVMPVPGSTYMIPRRAIELLQPDRRAPLMA